MMNDLLDATARRLTRALGLYVVRHQQSRQIVWGQPPDLSERNRNIWKAVAHFTMTSPERINALIDAVRYLVANEIDGAMVECGVWKGGSAMAMALTLLELGKVDRRIYLYDTFAGMPAPGHVDRSPGGASAAARFAKTRISDDSSRWCNSPLEEVKVNLFNTGYPKENFHFVKGKVEDTIPRVAPKEIALLRLDTDWYESTKHEMIHLFPLLKRNGVLIVDDYGHWEGARKAIDEYLVKNNICILLNRIDYTGRVGIKT